MGRKKKTKQRIYCADFETTVYTGQEHTEVWAAAIVELWTEDVYIYNSIYDFFDAVFAAPHDKLIYIHNLKFDGCFILSYLLNCCTFRQGLEQTDKGERFKSKRKLKHGEYTYIISDMGLWYEIVIKWYNNYITIRDSLKILPFSLKKLGEDFKTPHRKLDMEYTGYRYAGCKITLQEREYITNDVLVLKEALEIMYNMTKVKPTIGASCMAEYRKDYPYHTWLDIFPDLSALKLPDWYGANNYDAYIRRAYRGGWCYVVEGKDNKVYHNGTTADVNSLYPSMMHSDSGNYYPIGYPEVTGTGKPPAEYLTDKRYYTFLRVRLRFDIKDGYLPFITISSSWDYPAHTVLKTSDIIDYNTGERYSKVQDSWGKVHEVKPTLTLTMTDWELIQEHYNVYDVEYLDYVVFNTAIGIFDNYINKWREIKTHSEGAVRQIAKLYLNNLYGKFATSQISSFKIAYLNDGVLKFRTVTAMERPVVYIPIGAAITSYARRFTIRAAQKNYHGIDKPGFIYADTDSIHCDLQPDDIQGIVVHPTDFNKWAIECTWDEGLFVRAKTYIEHIIKEDGAEYEIKCAGMNKACKEVFLKGMADGKYKLTDFKVGLELPGKILPKQYPGGVVLTETTYKMTPRHF